MMRQPNKQTHFKLIAAFTAFTLVCSQVVAAAPITFSQPLVDGVLPLDVPIHSVDIPEHLAFIKETHGTFSANEPSFIYIEDAHANYDAQLKIKELLKWLHENEGIDLALLEGADSRFNPDRFRFFDKEEYNVALADELAKKGLVTGAELFLLEAGNGYKAVGIESGKLYDENLKTFRTVLRAEEETQKFLNELVGKLTQLEDHLVNPALKDLLRSERAYQNGVQTLWAWFQTLSREAARHLNTDFSDPYSQLAWPQLVRLSLLEKYEKEVDQTKLESEVADFTKKFSAANKGDENLIHSVESLLSDKLLESSSQSKNVRLLFEQLYAETVGMGINFKDYPVLSRKIGLLILRDELHFEKLENEISSLADMLFEKLAATESEKAILRLAKDAQILREAFSLELTQDSLAEFRERFNELKPARILERIHAVIASEDLSLSSSPNAFTAKQSFRIGDPKLADPRVRGDDNSTLNTTLSRVDAFYRGTEARDKVLVEKAFEELKTSGRKKAVLVTGGFHTANVTQAFKERGASFMVVTPKLGEIDKERSLYYEVMTATNAIASDFVGARFTAKQSPQGAAPVGAPGDNILLHELMAETWRLRAQASESDLFPTRVTMPLIKDLAVKNRLPANEMRFNPFSRAGDSFLNVRLVGRDTAWSSAGRRGSPDMPEKAVISDGRRKWVVWVGKTVAREPSLVIRGESTSIAIPEPRTPIHDLAAGFGAQLSETKTLKEVLRAFRDPSTEYEGAQQVNLNLGEINFYFVGLTRDMIQESNIREMILGELEDHVAAQGLFPAAIRVEHRLDTKGGILQHAVSTPKGGVKTDKSGLPQPAGFGSSFLQWRRTLVAGLFGALFVNSATIAEPPKAQPAKPSIPQATTPAADIPTKVMQRNLIDLSGRAPFHDAISVSGTEAGKLAVSFSASPASPMHSGVSILDAKTGDLLHERYVSLATSTEQLGDIAISGDGKTLAVVTSTRIIIINDETGQEVRSLEDVDSHHVALSYDGKKLVGIGGSHNVYVWNVETGELKRMLNFGGFNASDLYDIDVNQDGSQLAVVTEKRRQVFISAISEDGQILSTVRLDHTPLLEIPFWERLFYYDIKGVAFSPDGSTVVTYSKKHVFVWRISSGQGSLIHKIPLDAVNSTIRSGGRIQDAALTSDGTGAAFLISHTISRWIFPPAPKKEASPPVGFGSQASRTSNWGKKIKYGLGFLGVFTFTGVAIKQMATESALVKRAKENYAEVIQERFGPGEIVSELSLTSVSPLPSFQLFHTPNDSTRDWIFYVDVGQDFERRIRLALPVVEARRLPGVVDGMDSKHRNFWGEQMYRVDPRLPADYQTATERKLGPDQRIEYPSGDDTDLRLLKEHSIKQRIDYGDFIIFYLKTKDAPHDLVIIRYKLDLRMFEGKDDTWDFTDSMKASGSISVARIEVPKLGDAADSKPLSIDGNKLINRGDGADTTLFDFSQVISEPLSTPTSVPAGFGAEDAPKEKSWPSTDEEKAFFKRFVAVAERIKSQFFIQVKGSSVPAPQISPPPVASQTYKFQLLVYPEAAFDKEAKIYKSFLTFEFVDRHLEMQKDLDTLSSEAWPLGVEVETEENGKIHFFRIPSQGEMAKRLSRAIEVIPLPKLAGFGATHSEKEPFIRSSSVFQDEVTPLGRVRDLKEGENFPADKPLVVTVAHPQGYFRRFHFTILPDEDHTLQIAELGKGLFIVTENVKSGSESFFDVDRTVLTRHSFAFDPELNAVKINLRASPGLLLPLELTQHVFGEQVGIRELLKKIQPLANHPDRDKFMKYVYATRYEKARSVLTSMKKTVPSEDRANWERIKSLDLALRYFGRSIVESDAARELHSISYAAYDDVLIDILMVHSRRVLQLVLEQVNGTIVYRNNHLDEGGYLDDGWLEQMQRSILGLLRKQGTAKPEDFARIAAGFGAAGVEKALSDVNRKVINFNPGPAKIPDSVDEQLQRDLSDFKGTSIAITATSHRSKVFEDSLKNAEAIFRRLMNIPEDYAVLFLQGGGSTQFGMVAQNLYVRGKPMDVIETGAWSIEAIKDIRQIGKMRIIATNKEQSHRSLPGLETIAINPDASFVYLVSNETIDGIQWRLFPETGDVPLVADMSSDILSRSIDVKKFGLIFAGAQKNFGIAGVTVVIIRKDLARRAKNKRLKKMDRYSTHIRSGSLENTAPTVAVRAAELYLAWIEQEGGVEEMARRSAIKSKLLYDAIDQSSLFYNPVFPNDRSQMNVVFRVKGDREDMEAKFVEEAKAAGLVGLKGHRSVGGLRASLYTAVSIEDVQALIDFMRIFEARYSTGFGATNAARPGEEKKFSGVDDVAKAIFQALFEERTVTPTPEQWRRLDDLVVSGRENGVELIDLLTELITRDVDVDLFRAILFSKPEELSGALRADNKFVTELRKVKGAGFGVGSELQTDQSIVGRLQSGGTSLIRSLRVGLMRFFDSRDASFVVSNPMLVFGDLAREWLKRGFDNGNISLDSRQIFLYLGESQFHNGHISFNSSQAVVQLLEFLKFPLDVLQSFAERAKLAAEILKNNRPLTVLRKFGSWFTGRFRHGGRVSNRGSGVNSFLQQQEMYIPQYSVEPTYSQPQAAGFGALSDEKAADEIRLNLSIIRKELALTEAIHGTSLSEAHEHLDRLKALVAAHDWKAAHQFAQSIAGVTPVVHLTSPGHDASYAIADGYTKIHERLKYLARISTGFGAGETVKRESSLVNRNQRQRSGASRFTDDASLPATGFGAGRLPGTDEEWIEFLELGELVSDTGILVLSFSINARRAAANGEDWKRVSELLREGANGADAEGAQQLNDSIGRSDTWTFSEAARILRRAANEVTGLESLSRDLDQQGFGAGRKEVASSEVAGSKERETWSRVARVEGQVESIGLPLTAGIDSQSTIHEPRTPIHGSAAGFGAVKVTPTELREILKEIVLRTREILWEETYERHIEMKSAGYTKGFEGGTEDIPLGKDTTIWIHRASVSKNKLKIASALKNLVRELASKRSSREKRHRLLEFGFDVKDLTNLKRFPLQKTDVVNLLAAAYELDFIEFHANDIGPSGGFYLTPFFLLAAGFGAADQPIEKLKLSTLKRNLEAFAEEKEFVPGYAGDYEFGKLLVERLGKNRKDDDDIGVAVFVSNAMLLLDDLERAIKEGRSSGGPLASRRNLLNLNFNVRNEMARRLSGNDHFAAEAKRIWINTDAIAENETTGFGVEGEKVSDEKERSLLEKVPTELIIEVNAAFHQGGTSSYGIGYRETRLLRSLNSHPDIRDLTKEFRKKDDPASPWGYEILDRDFNPGNSPNMPVYLRIRSAGQADLRAKRLITKATIVFQTFFGEYYFYPFTKAREQIHALHREGEENYAPAIVRYAETRLTEALRDAQDLNQLYALLNIRPTTGFGAAHRAPTTVEEQDPRFQAFRQKIVNALTREFDKRPDYYREGLRDFATHEQDDVLGNDHFGIAVNRFAALRTMINNYPDDSGSFSALATQGGQGVERRVVELIDRVVNSRALTNQHARYLNEFRADEILQALFKYAGVDWPFKLKDSGAGFGTGEQPRDEGRGTMDEKQLAGFGAKRLPRTDKDWAALDELGEIKPPTIVWERGRSQKSYEYELALRELNRGVAIAFVERTETGKVIQTFILLVKGSEKESYTAEHAIDSRVFILNWDVTDKKEPIQPKTPAEILGDSHSFKLPSRSGWGDSFDLSKTVKLPGVVKIALKVSGHYAVDWGVSDDYVLKELKTESQFDSDPSIQAVEVTVLPRSTYENLVAEIGIGKSPKPVRFKSLETIVNKLKKMRRSGLVTREYPYESLVLLGREETELYKRLLEIATQRVQNENQGKLAFKHRRNDIANKLARILEGNLKPQEAVEDIGHDTISKAIKAKFGDEFVGKGFGADADLFLKDLNEWGRKVVAFKNLKLIPEFRSLDKSLSSIVELRVRSIPFMDIVVKDERSAPMGSGMPMDMGLINKMSENGSAPSYRASFEEGVDPFRKQLRSIRRAVNAGRWGEVLIGLMQINIEVDLSDVTTSDTSDKRIQELLNKIYALRSGARDTVLKNEDAYLQSFIDEALVELSAFRTRIRANLNPLSEKFFVRKNESGEWQPIGTLGDNKGQVHLDHQDKAVSKLLDEKFDATAKAIGLGDFGDAKIVLDQFLFEQLDVINQELEWIRKMLTFFADITEGSGFGTSINEDFHEESDPKREKLAEGLKRLADTVLGEVALKLAITVGAEKAIALAQDVTIVHIHEMLEARIGQLLIMDETVLDMLRTADPAARPILDPAFLKQLKADPERYKTNILDYFSGQDTPALVRKTITDNRGTTFDLWEADSGYSSEPYPSRLLPPYGQLPKGFGAAEWREKVLPIARELGVDTSAVIKTGNYVEEAAPYFLDMLQVFGKRGLFNGDKGREFFKFALGQVERIRDRWADDTDYVKEAFLGLAYLARLGLFDEDAAKRLEYITRIFENAIRRHPAVLTKHLGYRHILELSVRRNLTEELAGISDGISERFNELYAIDELPPNEVGKGISEYQDFLRTKIIRDIGEVDVFHLFYRDKLQIKSFKGEDEKLAPAKPIEYDLRTVKNIFGLIKVDAGMDTRPLRRGESKAGEFYWGTTAKNPIRIHVLVRQDPKSPLKEMIYLTARQDRLGTMGFGVAAAKMPGILRGDGLTAEEIKPNADVEEEVKFARDGTRSVYLGSDQELVWRSLGFGASMHDFSAYYNKLDSWQKSQIDSAANYLLGNRDDGGTISSVVRSILAGVAVGKIPPSSGEIYLAHWGASENALGVLIRLYKRFPSDRGHAGGFGAVAASDELQATSRRVVQFELPAVGKFKAPVSLAQGFGSRFTAGTYQPLPTIALVGGIGVMTSFTGLTAPVEFDEGLTEQALQVAEPRKAITLSEVERIRSVLALSPEQILSALQEVIPYGYGEGVAMISSPDGFTEASVAALKGTYDSKNDYLVLPSGDVGTKNRAIVRTLRAFVGGKEDRVITVPANIDRGEFDRLMRSSGISVPVGGVFGASTVLSGDFTVLPVVQWTDDRLDIDGVTSADVETLRGDIRTALQKWMRVLIDAHASGATATVKQIQDILGFTIDSQGRVYVTNPSALASAFAHLALDQRIQHLITQSA